MAEQNVASQQNPITMAEETWRTEVMRRLDDITELLKQILLLEKRDVGSGGLGH